MRLVQRDAAFGEGERLLVPVLHHRDDRLVPAHQGEHVVGVHAGREALRLAQRAHRLVVSACLPERRTGERMHEREVAAIARRVQRRRGLADVLADDGDVADFLVTLAELVVSQSNGPGVVADLRLLEGADVMCDGARLIATRGRHAAVQPPERRQAAGRQGFAQRVGWPAERRGRLLEIVLEQPCLGEHRSHGDLVVARQRGRAQGRCEHLRSFRPAAAFERGAGAREQRLQRRGGHAGSIGEFRV